MGTPVKVLHVITGLGVGGAEMMLAKVIGASDRSRVEHVVLSLTTLGALGPRIVEQGVPVIPLNIGGVRSAAQALMRARSVVFDFRPHLVMTWLHHADLFGVLLKMFVPGLRLAWNLRCADLPVEDIPRRNRWLVRLLALFSGVPAVVLANAEAGRVAHAAIGYKPRQWEIIPNGFDTEVFAPDPVARDATRREWGVANDDFVIGIVGRYHPMKGYAMFVEAAGRFSRMSPKAMFVLAGRGVDQSNAELMERLETAGVSNRSLLLGQRSDIASMMNGFDLLACTSTSEGFPNVIGEAMACGVPCVATAAGDSALVIGATGQLVPVGDAEAMVSAWKHVSSMSSNDFRVLKHAARQRILTNYEIGAVVERYQRLYANVGRTEEWKPS